MTHENLQKYTAIYRCSDDITNLKIKIKLCDASGSEEKVFAWQEKRFSKSEREFYRDEKNCVTDLEKKYHNDVKLATDVNGIFSYVNDDDFVLKEEINNFCETDEAYAEYDYRNSLLAALRNPSGCKYEFDAMFIMADLGEFIDNTWIKNEQVLCTLKYDKKHKLLSIFPDFTNFTPYAITLDGNTVRKFEYFIENLSLQMFEEDQLKEKELIKKLNSHKSEMLKQFDSNFHLPPKNKLQIYLFFEILWAKQFEYDTIYVQYFIDLPPDWSCDNHSQLQGVSQTCHTKSEDSVAHFGHQFEVTLEYNIEKLNNDKIPNSPYIYFEVISRDTWNRYRTEGLTYKNLPVNKPGIYRFELQCFRLIPDNIPDQLRRYFIGDCSNYDDISWIGLPKAYDGAFLNKYGTNTVGTGVIEVRINVLQQSQAFLKQYREDGDEKRDIFEKLSCSSLVKSVEQVLRAFKRARRNMIEAKKKL